MNKSVERGVNAVVAGRKGPGGWPARVRRARGLPCAAWWGVPGACVRGRQRRLVCTSCERCDALDDFSERTWKDPDCYFIRLGLLSFGGMEGGGEVRCGRHSEETHVTQQALNVYPSSRPGLSPTQHAIMAEIAMPCPCNGSIESTSGDFFEILPTSCVWAPELSSSRQALRRPFGSRRCRRCTG